MPLGCTTISVQLCDVGAHGTHVAWSSTQCFPYTVSGTICDDSTLDSPGGDDGAGLVWGGSTGTGAGNYNNGGTSINFNVPTRVEPPYLNMTEFMSVEDNYKFNQILQNVTLNVKGHLWFGTDVEKIRNVYSYLFTNNFSAESKEFIKNLIDYLLQNPNVLWYDLMNNRTAFDTSTGDLDNNSDDGFDTTTYSYFNSAQNWSNIPSVIPINKFVGWNRSAHPNWKCMEYSKEQLRVMGYKISNYGATGQTFQIYTTQNGVNNTALTNGLNYLKYALSNNIPVIVGVDNHSGSPNPETDNTTDHFIVIVGMGQDSNGKYFQFYDNASGDPTQGANISNKLYYNSTTGIISGSSMTSYAINNGLNPYKITMIRKSKSL